MTDNDKQLELDFEDPDFWDDDNLSERQLEFVREYCLSLNATQAYLKAYYPTLDPEIAKDKTSKEYRNAGKRGSILKNTKGINDAIRRFLHQRAKTKQVNADWVVDKLREVVERSLGDIKPLLDSRGKPIVIEDDKGNKTYQYAYDSAGANSALKTLTKHQIIAPFFRETLEITEKSGLCDRMTRIRRAALDNQDKANSS